MMENNLTKYDEKVKRMKNNRLVVWALILFAIIVGVSQLLDSGENIMRKLFKKTNEVGIDTTDIQLIKPTNGQVNTQDYQTLIVGKWKVVNIQNDERYSKKDPSADPSAIEKAYKEYLTMKIEYSSDKKYMWQTNNRTETGTYSITIDSLVHFPRNGDMYFPFKISFLSSTKMVYSDMYNVGLVFQKQ